MTYEEIQIADTYRVIRQIMLAGRGEDENPLSQSQVGEILKVSQPAVQQYLAGTMGMNRPVRELAWLYLVEKGVATASGIELSAMLVDKGDADAD